MNGDLRVAFDILKSCFVDLQKSLKSKETTEDIKVTMIAVTEVFK
jgi:hypothetical protein